MLRITLKLIFYSKLNRTIRLKKSHLYNLSITFKFNNTVYNNSKLFNKWINKELTTAIISNGLLVIDYAAFYKTELVLEKL